jgi:hypothetical protein
MAHDRCSERACSKARWVVGHPPMQLEAASACQALVRELQTRIEEWRLPSDRTLDRIDADYGRADVIIAGYYGNTMRLLTEVAIDLSERTAEITLIATKGAQSAESVTWGAIGPSIGNSVLVAMLFDLGICVLRRQGVRALTNHPWDERLRLYYASMGFSDGTELDLEDESTLSVAFDFIERAYARHGLALLIEG